VSLPTISGFEWTEGWPLDSSGFGIKTERQRLWPLAGNRHKAWFVCLGSIRHPRSESAATQQPAFMLCRNIFAAVGIGAFSGLRTTRCETTPVSCDRIWDRLIKPPVDDPSVIEYEGISGFPSFCQIAHRRLGDRVQFALIHMANGGTSPTNMLASLATYMRQRFYADVDAGRIDWYDVHPASVYHLGRTQILSVAMQHANGIYSKPEGGRAPAISEDWAAFIEAKVARSRAAHNSEQKLLFSG
jgi:hypothetical protein